MLQKLLKAFPVVTAAENEGQVKVEEAPPLLDPNGDHNDIPNSFGNHNVNSFSGLEPSPFEKNASLQEGMLDKGFRT